jgi:hypothetical protein
MARRGTFLSGATATVVDQWRGRVVKHAIQSRISKQTRPNYGDQLFVHAKKIDFKLGMPTPLYMWKC